MFEQLNNQESSYLPAGARLDRASGGVDKDGLNLRLSSGKCTDAMFHRSDSASGPSDKLPDPEAIMRK